MQLLSVIVLAAMTNALATKHTTYVRPTDVLKHLDSIGQTVPWVKGVNGSLAVFEQAEWAAWEQQVNVASNETRRSLKERTLGWRCYGSGSWAYINTMMHAAEYACWGFNYALKSQAQLYGVTGLYNEAGDAMKAVFSLTQRGTSIDANTCMDAVETIVQHCEGHHSDTRGGLHPMDAYFLSLDPTTYNCNC